MSRVFFQTCVVVSSCIAMAISNVHSIDAQDESIGGAGSRSTPRFQTQAEIAALPPSSSGSTVRAGFTPNAVTTGNRTSRNNGYGNGFAFRTTSATSDVYPYPDSRGQRVALQTSYALPRTISNAQLSNQLSIGSNSTISRLRNTSQQSNYASPAIYPTQNRTQLMTAYRTPVYQAPTLGLGTTSIRTAQTCYCQPGYSPAGGTNRTTVAYQAPVPNSPVGSGLAAPPLNIQVPGQQNSSQPALPQNGQPNFQSNYQYPAVAPQNGAQGANWWTPFVKGTGNYPPLVRQNMPVGTYLGQGSIGQPTAYVDGQPIRNLLRYVFP